MTAQLTDHYGAIPVAAFDADRPKRPYGNPAEALHLAETRLWGSPAYSLIPGPLPTREGRRMAAVGALALDGDAEALCNMRGEDPNDDDAWNTARTDIMTGAVAFDH